MTSNSNTNSDRRDRFLEPSPYASDRGELVGVDPRKIPVSDLRALGHPESYPKIIRAICLACVYTPSEIRKCVMYDCPAWPVRMGSNVFHKGRGGVQQIAEPDPSSDDPSGTEAGDSDND